MSVRLLMVAGIRVTKCCPGQIVQILKQTPVIVGVQSAAAAAAAFPVCERHLHSSTYGANSNEEIDPADTFGIYSGSAATSTSAVWRDMPSRPHRRRVDRIQKSSEVWTPRIKVKDVSNHRESTQLAESNRLRTGEERREQDVQDTFGLLDKTRLTRLAEDEEGDEEEKRDEEAQLNRKMPNKWNTMWWYGRQIKKLADNKQLTEALAYFKRMIEVDRVKPDSYVYSNLIGGCGRAGYTKMAFKLHRQMKERGLLVPLAVYTGLFNACANSPWPENGLRLARKLQAEIDAKSIILNSTNYNAAIKAFGRCNDLQVALRLVDEMITKKVGVTTATFNFMLIACASDKKQGFLRTVQVWKKMRENRIKPDIFSFNLLIRATRDCGIGDPKIAGQLLLNADNKQKSMEMLMNHPSPETPTLLDSGLEFEDEIASSLTTVAVQSGELELPDFLSPWSKAGSVVSLNAAETPHDRLFMLGGCAGILRRMRLCDVEPQLKTFTELIEIVPENEELQLIQIMDKRNVTADVDFFNVLIKKRSCRGDLNGAKDVLNFIAQRHLYTDIATFGALALSCKRWDDAKQLLEDMETSGFRPNSKILGALIKLACHSMNFWYLIDMLNQLKVNGVQVDTRMLQDIEKCVAMTKKFIVKKERAGEKSHIVKLSRSFQIFYIVYKKFLKENDVEMPEHPWKIYELDQSAEEVEHS